MPWRGRSKRGPALPSSRATGWACPTRASRSSPAAVVEAACRLLDRLVSGLPRDRERSSRARAQGGRHAPDHRMDGGPQAGHSRLSSITGGSRCTRTSPTSSRRVSGRTLPQLARHGVAELKKGAPPQGCRACLGMGIEDGPRPADALPSPLCRPDEPRQGGLARRRGGGRRHRPGGQHVQSRRLRGGRSTGRDRPSTTARPG